MTVPDEPVIPLARAQIGEAEEAYVSEVLRSRILALGPMRRRFETAFAEFCGTSHAVAVSSDTAGLHLALRLAGVRAGDEVITTAVSFVASANAILYQGATPVFVDVDDTTFNLDPGAIEAAVTPRTRAILPVHIFGYPCDLDRIDDIASRQELAVVEDACQAVGAQRNGRRMGSWGNSAVFAFYPNKQMTTGEGGMVTTDDEQVRAGLESLSNQGRADDDEWLLHDRLGFNYRMDELSAAVGLAQVERLEHILATRRAVADTYAELLAGIEGVTLPCENEHLVERSWFVYVVRLDPGIDRTSVMEGLRSRGVSCKPYLPAIHLQPFYRELGHRPGELPIAEAVARSTVALPFFTDLQREDQERVARALREVVAGL